MRKSLSFLIWLAVAFVGALAYFTIATQRNEPLNSGYLIVAALCTYAIGYRFYSKWIAAKVLMLNDRRATPCEIHEDGKDYVKTNKWIVFGHHFAAISGPGPLMGPVLAAQFGYLPGTLWILIGVVLGGAVQDLVVLVASIRRDGKSIGQMLRDELSSSVGVLGVLAIMAITTILLAVLALVVVKALAESPWGIFTVGATIPIAMFMGGYLRFLRVGKVLEVSIIGVVLLLLAVWGGQAVHMNKDWAELLHIQAEPLAWAVIVYGFAASVLPVWLLLAPRDYLSTFMKFGTITALAVGILLVLPNFDMPAISKFVDGTGLVVPGGVFPFCFITIACGSISGFHTLIASGTTPKIITRETDARLVGYGGMLLESMVAIVAMIAACTLEPNVYLSMNVNGVGTTLEARAADIKSKVEASGFTHMVPNPAQPGTYHNVPVQVDVQHMHDLAAQMGESTLFGRTGGAATLAVGMARIFSELTRGRWLDLWYHFALMFEALFILTTLDAGTRVGRYLLQDALGNIWKPLRDTKNLGATLLASALVVLGWGFFLIMGVRDPEGGVKALWPLFGIANQLLASIALCLGTTILLKLALQKKEQAGWRKFAPVFATLVPLVVLLSITLTAGVQKVFHSSPKVGFLALANATAAKIPDLEAAAAAATAEQAPVAQATLAAAKTILFNNRVDAAVTLIFLVLVVAMLVLTIREWLRLIRGSLPPRLSETEPVWLPESAVAGGRPAHVLGTVALGLAMLKELSGEAAMAREAERAAKVCDCQPEQLPASARRNVFLSSVEHRFSGVNRCC